MDTSLSLLQRLGKSGPAGPDNQAWERFVDLYTPLLYFWARERSGLGEDEAAELVQEVFTVLVQKLRDFRYDADKSFRGWLRTVLLNKWRESLRKRVPVLRGNAALDGLQASDAIGMLEQEEYQKHLARRALELMQAEFPEAVWQACWATVVEDRPAAEVAARLGMSVNSVYLAKSRVLRRLREELKGLI